MKLQQNAPTSVSPRLMQPFGTANSKKEKYINKNKQKEKPHSFDAFKIQRVKRGLVKGIVAFMTQGLGKSKLKKL